MGATSGVDVAYDALLAEDDVLRDMAERYGRPNPFVWAGGGAVPASNFAALLVHVISQQLSTRVALLLFDRLQEAVGAVPDPKGVAALGVDRLRGLGLSHAKAVAVAGLAEMQLAGALDPDRLGALDDTQAIAALTAAHGVGPWTAQMFLIHQLRRPDVLPAGDLGIRHAVQAAWSLPREPSIQEVEDRGAGWAPYRTYAAALLWASLRPVPAPA